MSLGDQVWVDANNNGKIDAGEAGIPGVTVILHWVNPATGFVNLLIHSLLMPTDIIYFDSLTAGKYLVEIPASNFASGGALYKYISSNGLGYDLTTATGSPGTKQLHLAA